MCIYRRVNEKQARLRFFFYHFHTEATLSSTSTGKSLTIGRDAIALKSLSPSLNLIPEAPLEPSLTLPNTKAYYKTIYIEAQQVKARRPAE